MGTFDRTVGLFPVIDYDESLIPKGMYCYNDKGLCPYWRFDPTKPEQESGYCQVLGEGDWEDKGFGLLWDQCKECGIKDDWEEDDA